jgi:uncharacterized glyoxalase superfamily protein PhnB
MGGWGGVTLAYNVRSPEEVNAVLAQARAAGATIARSPPCQSMVSSRAGFVWSIFFSCASLTPQRSRSTANGEPRRP